MKANALENHLLLLLYNNSNIANLGDATGVRGSTGAGSLYVAGHTAYPGEAGDQTSSELTYTGYARAAVARSGGGFTVSGSQVQNAATVGLGQRSDAGAVQKIYFWSVGFAASGASEILHFGHCGSAAKPFAALTSDTVYCPGHGLSVNDEIVLLTRGATLPTGAGISDGAIVFVKTAPDADTLTLSTTSGGATIDITVGGAGWLAKLTPLSVSQNITPQFLASQITIGEE